MKSTAGTVIVTSTQSYAGATVINGGTLRLQAPSTPAGTVADYTFSSAASLFADSSGNGYTLATASGTPVYSSSGVFGGGALQLNGSTTLTTASGLFPRLCPPGRLLHRLLLDQAHGREP